MNEVAILSAQISAIGLSLADGDSEALATMPAIETKSILQFYLEMNRDLFGLIPIGTDLAALTEEASTLLKKQFAEVNVLTQANDFTGGPINFLSEVEVALA